MHEELDTLFLFSVMLLENSRGLKRGTPAGREDLSKRPPEGSRSQTLPCHKAVQKGKAKKETLAFRWLFVTLMPIFFTEYRVQSRRDGEDHAMLYFPGFCTTPLL